MSRINYSDSEGGAPQTIVACELIQQAYTCKHNTLPAYTPLCIHEFCLNA